MTQPDADGRRAVRVGAAAMLAATAVWIAIPILVKVALRAFDPILISASRLPVAALLLAALHRARGGRLRDLLPDSGWHLLGGVALGVNYQLFALGLSLTTAGAGTVMIQVQIVTLVLLARWFLGERLSPVKLAAIAGVMAGGALVLAAPGAGAPGAGAPDAGGELTAPAYRTGNLIMVAAAAGFGCYGLASRALARRGMATREAAKRSVAGRRSAAGSARGRGAALPIVVPILGIASVVNLCLLPFARWPESAPAGPLAALLALGVIGTGANYALMTVAFRRLSAATAGTITAITPLGVIALAAVTLGEPAPLSMAAAAAVVTASLVALMWDERRAGRPGTPPHRDPAR